MNTGHDPIDASLQPELAEEAVDPPSDTSADDPGDGAAETAATADVEEPDRLAAGGWIHPYKGSSAPSAATEQAQQPGEHQE